MKPTRPLQALVLVLTLATPLLRASGAGDWERALAQMPLNFAVKQLNRTNCVELMLGSFRSNEVVKGLVFMPGATDEFYMFRRANAGLTNASPSLLDALNALARQTLIRADFRRPLLLMHTEEDMLEPDVTIMDQSTAERLKTNQFGRKVSCNDNDWDILQPLLRRGLRMDVRPWKGSTSSWHFYRHSFTAAGVSDWEMLECAALAGKSRLTVRKKQVVFEPDTRLKGAGAVEH